MTQLNRKRLCSAATHLYKPCKAPKRYKVPFLVSQGRLACVLFFFVLLSCSRLIAQTATGSIAGTVLEKSGSVVANAAVTLTNMDTNQVRTASTNDRGYYSLPLLPPASYRLNIETPGFSRAPITSHTPSRLVSSVLRRGASSPAIVTGPQTSVVRIVVP